MDGEEFDAYYAASFHRLVGQLSVMLGDRDEAADCVQEAFVRAWDHRRRLDAAPDAWMRTTAYRIGVSRWRRRRTARRDPDRALQPSGHRGGPDPHHVALVAALRQLPEATRRTLVLHHLCDLGVDQVAAELGVPVGTVKARLSRGRAALATLLRDDDLEVPRA